jgi:hypothetical protein
MVMMMLNDVYSRTRVAKKRPQGLREGGDDDTAEGGG